MRILYSIILYCLSPILVMRLLWRSRSNPAYRQRLPERFGYACSPSDRPLLWLHSVSVGETLAAVPLVQSLIEKYPAHTVLVTTTTPTGSEQVKKVFADRVLHVYTPYDLPGAVQRFLDCYKPEIAIIMETEIWANLFHACRQRQVPLILANARLSEKSAQGYRKLSSLTRATLQCISTIASQAEADAQRFRALGASAEQLRVIGSIKFDLNLPAGIAAQAVALRSQFGTDRPVWIAASTHEGEEEQVIDVYLQMKDAFADLLLILVPRHPERFERVAAICEKQQLQLVRRSSSRACEADTHVYLGDTMGELMLLYAAADVAFVGGSLVPVGGHNLLEPAALGIATVTGPHMHNFEEITSRLLECSGVVQVSDTMQLASSIEMLLRDANSRKQMGENAMAFVAANRGALAQLQALIDDALVAKTHMNGVQE